jgi:hypothetical protein
MYVLILPNYLDTAQLLSVTRIEEKLNCVIDGSYFDVPRVEFTAYEKRLETGRQPDRGGGSALNPFEMSPI